jgi:hypothetical protein
MLRPTVKRRSEIEFCPPGHRLIGRWPAISLSGRRDLNPRPLDPQSSALPSCATSRCWRAMHDSRYRLAHASAGTRAAYPPRTIKKPPGTIKKRRKAYAGSRI